MCRTARFPIVAVIVVAALLAATAATALAQGVSQVRAGSEVAVANNGECRPVTDVALYFEGAGVAEVRVGSAVSDAAGSFEATVVIPAEADEGAAAILVDCGLDSAVLTYDLEVLGSGLSLGSLVGPVLVGVAVIAIVGLIALMRRRRAHAVDGGRDADGKVAAAAPDGAPLPVPAAPVAVDAVDGVTEFTEFSAAAGAFATPPAPAPSAAMARAQLDHGDDDAIDDGADYWFWEAATSAGLRRRVACMTETTFHLHEVSVEAFQPMLDHLVEVGPDVALAQAFVRIPVTAVDRVVREGSVVHIEGRGASGPRRQTIDLADSADGVVEMLARRLPVVEAARMQEWVR